GSASVWQNIFLKAAQTWAQQTNVNFSLDSDNGVTLGTGSYQQGDPAMGDVRIGGYSLRKKKPAPALMPPPAQNHPLAGDVLFNTAQSFNIGSTYDLQSVAEHEFGHALGLLHSTNILAVMYGTYTSTKTTLATDDINGIRAIYGTRNQDSYDAAASN